MHPRPAQHLHVQRALLVIAAFVATLGMLAMHTVLGHPSADAANEPESGHSAHGHSHDDQPASPHSHSFDPSDAHVGSDLESGAAEPCSPCPGCAHESATCGVAPARAGVSDLTLSASALAPSPFQLAGWPDAQGYPVPATPAPPCLISLSVSRT